MSIFNFLADTTSTAFSTPDSFDIHIINFFNSLGWWGNLLLLLISLVLATVFGGILGLQREVNGHPAGFRTHVLISLGSALIMILSIYGVPGEATRDPMRLAAAGVTGVGFLGAGAIIKNGITVKGLTTSATIWVTMAIGMACGAGYFVLGTITTIIALLTLVVFKNIENWASRRSTNIMVVVESNCPVFKDLIPLLEKHNVVYREFNTTLVELEGSTVLRIHFKCNEREKGSILTFIEDFRAKVKPIEISIIK